MGQVTKESGSTVGLEGALRRGMGCERQFGGGIPDCGIRCRISAQRHTTCSAEERKGASSGPSGSCERGM